jgi:hypothetical protein
MRVKREFPGRWLMCLGVLPLWWCVAECSVAAAPVAVAAETAPVVSEVELDEVNVIGRKLYQIRSELVEALDSFYALYNDLNTERDFDIHCGLEAPTGTRIKRRVCRLQFLQDAEAEQAQELIAGMRSNPPSIGNYVEPPELRWLRRQDEYRQNAREIMLSSPALQERAQKVVELQAEYDRASKRRNKKDDPP